MDDTTIKQTNRYNQNQVRVKTMDNVFTTGNPKVDAGLLVVAWVCAFITPQIIPIILSSLASALVIINQIIIFRNRKTKK